MPDPTIDDNEPEWRCYTSQTRPLDVEEHPDGDIPDDWRSRRLWSLWDMLERYGALFAEGFANLTEAKHLAALFGLNGGNPPEPIVRERAKEASKTLRLALIYADMQEHIPSLDRLDLAIDGPSPMQLLQLSQAIMHTLSGIKDSLVSENFFHPDQRDVGLYLDNEPFGPDVTKKFPKATEDISEAAKCLALQRPTACVFHLMRAMEGAVQAFGRKLKVAINVETETWYQIGQHVDKAIGKLPAQTPREKKRKVELAAAAANLNAVRIAQRNDVMHPKQTYSRDEALEVFRATRAFMMQFSGVI